MIEVETQLAESTHTISTLQAQLASIPTPTPTPTHTRDQDTQTHEDAQSLDQATQRITELTGALEALQAEMTTKDALHAAAVQQATQQSAELKSALEALQAVMETKDALHAAVVADLHARVDAERVGKEGLQTQLEHTREETKVVKEQVVTQAGEVEHLRAELARADTLAEGLRAALSERDAAAAAADDARGEQWRQSLMLCAQAHDFYSRVMRVSQGMLAQPVGGAGTGCGPVPGSWAQGVASQGMLVQPVPAPVAMPGLVAVCGPATGAVGVVVRQGVASQLKSPRALMSPRAR